MYMAFSALKNPDFREFFTSLQTNKGRLNLIEREHEKEMKHQRFVSMFVRLFSYVEPLFACHMRERFPMLNQNKLYC